jgi:hypothetical protein
MPDAQLNAALKSSTTCLVAIGVMRFIRPRGAKRSGGGDHAKRGGGGLLQGGLPRGPRPFHRANARSPFPALRGRKTKQTPP